MKDRISKKDFNKKMKELEKENQSIDTKMSSYYKSPGGDLFETIVFNLAFVLLNALVLTYLYMYLTSQDNSKCSDTKVYYKTFSTRTNLQTLY